MGTIREGTGANGDSADAPDCTSADVMDGRRVVGGWEVASGMVVAANG
jgi:hypothetical protein